jgi:thiamine monophosphate kinase
MDIDHLPCFGEATPDIAAESGEEYELAITAPESFDAAAFEAEFGIAITRIGTVSAATAGTPGVSARMFGRDVTPPRGFDHFTR